MKTEHRQRGLAKIREMRKSGTLKIPKDVYPRFRLYWETSKVNRAYTVKKGSFLKKLQSLQKIKSLKKCWFVVEYKKKDQAGEYTNRSIVYTDPKRCLRVARVFTAKTEISFIMNGL